MAHLHSKSVPPNHESQHRRCAIRFGIGSVCGDTCYSLFLYRVAFNSIRGLYWITDFVALSTIRYLAIFLAFNQLLLFWISNLWIDGVVMWPDVYSKPIWHSVHFEVAHWWWVVLPSGTVFVVVSSCGVLRFKVCRLRIYWQCTDSSLSLCTVSGVEPVILWVVGTVSNLYWIQIIYYLKFLLFKDTTSSPPHFQRLNSCRTLNCKSFGSFPSSIFLDLSHCLWRFLVCPRWRYFNPFHLGLWPYSPLFSRYIWSLCVYCIYWLYIHYSSCPWYLRYSDGQETHHNKRVIPC